METTEADKKNQLVPFNGIGLCFSGGGYRATFFALGVVSYLNKVQYQEKSLLSEVIAISTVSGGTILGVAYAKAAQSKDFKFSNFYNKFYNEFTPNNDRLLERAISKFRNDQLWLSGIHKNRSLINAFALTYAEMELFKGNFDVFEKTPHSRLKNVCFNATDFSFGLPFRFQNGGVFGNNPLKSSELLDQLKYKIPLGDMVASSSCFPIGFEPLLFPDDYLSNREDDLYKKLKQQEKYAKGVGIMDGGITDNQGIESILNISRRVGVKDEFNLLIVNDVASYKMTPWERDVEEINKKTSIKRVLSSVLKLASVRPIYWILLVLGIICLVLTISKIIPQRFSQLALVISGLLIGVGGLLTWIGALLSGFKRTSVSWVKKLFKKNVPEALMDDILLFETLEVGLVKQLLTNRLTSGMKMINDVFLKQIRRLNYDVMYLNDSLDNKRITSTVYQLNGQETAYGLFKFHKDIVPKPSNSLEEIALVASQAPTALWWDQKDVEVERMDALIACGQFTTCYNLLSYVLELKNKGITSNSLDQLEASLRKDWEGFNENPKRWV